MRKPQGYAILTDPDTGKQEWDTFTCAHCQYVQRVAGGQDPSSLGGFCGMCYAHICKRCTDKGVCEPFEKKLERHEASARFGRALGLG